MAEPNTERPEVGDFFGTHRVLDQNKCLPQAADKLDNTLPIYSSEVLISVEKLNIDSASFVQMEKQTGQDEAEIANIILGNTQTRGKQHNSETGSGGMLVGTVEQIGSQYSGPLKDSLGKRVASLVSLTLTPLQISKIKKVHSKSHQLDVDGKAVLFSSSIAAELPEDFSERLAMAIFDVAGAPATVHARVKTGDTVVVVGAGGKAGLLSCVAAREKAGSTGRIIAIEPFEGARKDLEKLGICDDVLDHDASDAIGLQARIASLTHDKMGDVVINVASAPHTELSSILAANSSAQVIFFGMATSFSRVALGAEGVAATAELVIGNGYVPGHASFALDCVRGNEVLKQIFRSRYDR